VTNSGVGGQNWKKAGFYNADTDAKVPIVQCHFNPNEFTVKRQNKWESKGKSGGAVADVTFGGIQPRTLDMTLIFDSYDSQTDVTDDVDKLLSLMDVPSGGSTTSGRGSRPPHVQFGWGDFRSFRAVITQVSQKFTLFKDDGTPLRATLQVTMQEVPGTATRNWKKGQNPTSQAIGARKVRTVQPGDTIDWLAAEELGDPASWRLIAEANDLDDPRRLRPGQVLVIPEEL
jgi:hypothetical protein